MATVRDLFGTLGDATAESFQHLGGIPLENIGAALPVVAVIAVGLFALVLIAGLANSSPPSKPPAPRKRIEPTL